MAMHQIATFLLAAVGAASADIRRIEWTRSDDVGATYTLSLRAKTASEPVRVVAGLKEPVFEAENLLAGTDYEWFAQSVSPRGGCKDAGHGEFSTKAGGVRCASVPGARNVRDIGQVRVVRDVPYDPSIGKVGSGDLYLPAGVEKGLVLLIHGGGWAYGDRRMCDGVADFFVRELGMAVYNIDYRLASARHPFPACADDCVKAARVALSPEFRAKHGLVSHRLWVCGGSAGGHLALWVGIKIGAPGVAGVLDFSGIGDAAIDRAANPSRYPIVFGGTATDEQIASMSITSMKLPREGPPVLCTHAVDDTVVPIASAEAFVSAYRAAGSRCEFFRYRATEEMDRLTGHMIWIPGSVPHKLIPSLEREFARFIDRVEGVRR